MMNNRTTDSRLWAIALASALFIPAQAAFADIDASLLPDGSYPAHVDKVIDPKHVKVTMQGTIKVTLESTSTFADVKDNDEITVTLSRGKVTAFSKK